MIAFAYRAVASDGQITRGAITEESAAAAEARLHQRGMTLLDLRPRRQGVSRPLPRRHLAILFRNLAALTAAGVPLDRAVASSRFLADGRLLDMVQFASARLREGRPLSSALDDGSGAVPPVVTGMLRGGERVGRIAEALKHVAEHLERDAALMARVRQALAYPLMLVIVGGIAMVVLLTRVVPKFAVLLSGSGTEPPASTRALLAVANLVHDHRLVFGAGAAAAGLGILAGARVPGIRVGAGRLMRRLPVVRQLSESLASARVCAVLGGMLQSGGAVLPGLVAAGEAAGNPEVRDRLRDAAGRVREGAGLARALSATRAIDSTAVQLIGIGEESGSVAEMALRASDLSSLQAQRSLDTIVTMVEPALILFFGAVVAFVAAALLQAVYGIQAGTLS